MASSHHNVDQVTTNDDEISQPAMNILHTNLCLVPYLDVYSAELQMVKGVEGPSKGYKVTMKKKQEEKPREVEEELVEETIPTKTSKWGEPAAKKHGAKRVKKLQFTRKGVVLRVLSTPGSPTSKKHQALDVD
ncbi:unnamed protein product [Lactuca saligna]|uniref:Uncharacterized protein n=1 Tax=Lactuca saligna TaxID=75948 RepID=A0AA36E1N1_LACSI|nr:unnamed protein product [Lactuca saligna]